MTKNEAIKELKDENEQCYDQCEGCCSEVENNVCTCRDAIILSVLEQYRAIGTIEECREAVEKQRGKKPNIGNDNGKKRKCCSVCGCFYSPTSRYCPKCGQAIEQSDTP